MTNEISKKLAEFSEEELIQIYKNVFDTPGGQLVLEDLKNRCYYYLSTAPHENSVHANELILKEGMRKVVLQIELLLNYEPEIQKEEIE